MAEYTQTYWYELIDKYRSGKISKEERFQLEKQALDDPFLFDALEGFSLYEDEKGDKKEEKKETKIFTLPRIAAVASVVFLVAVMYTLRMDNNLQPESDQSIAMVLEEDKKNIDAIEGVEEETIISVEETLPTSKTIVKEAEPTKDEPMSEGQVQKPVPESNAVAKKQTEKEEVTPPSTTASTDNAKLDSNDEKVESNEQENIFEEHVKDEDEIVIVQKERTIDEGAIDQDADKVVDIVNANSFESKVKQPESDLVPIVSDSNLSAAESVRKKSKGQSSFYYEAVPVIGKKIFDDYAKERIDKRGLRQEKPQEVTIEFTIDKNGNLTDFHHIFTGCPECGPFAISILQNSGEWKTVPPGFFGKARYTFVF